jgi:uncharacterized protein (TIGR02453 family)
MDFTALLSYLKKLKQNNHKEWFDANKKEYEKLKQQWLEFIGDVIRLLAEKNKALEGLDPKKCVFRINRDIRFSKDKSPYKTNFGASISLTGNKNDFCGYYIHIEPSGCFLAGGVYMPSADVLNAIRQEIDYNFDEFESLLSKNSFKKYFKKLTGDKLVRPPKGYDASHPAIEYLKHKNFLMEFPLTDKQLSEKEFSKVCSNVFEAMTPVIDFLNRARQN